MAITIITVPKIVTPVYNNIVFTASSTNTAQTNFSYLVDIYINGSATKTIRYRVSADPDGYMFTNIASVLEQSLTYDLLAQFNTSSSVLASNSFLTYVVKIGEEYDVSGTLTQYPDLYVSSSNYAFNGSLTKEDNINFNYLDYTLQSSDSKFLTNAPRVQNVGLNDTGFLSILNASDFNLQLEVETFDSNGVVIDYFLIDEDSDGFLIQIPSCPSSLNSIDYSYISSGTAPIIAPNTAYYYLRVLSVDSSKISELFTFNVADYCDDYIRLIYQNRFGQFDAFNFTKKVEDKTSVEKKFYKKNANELVNGVYTESLTDREKVQHYTKTTPSIAVQSDWLTEEENNHLVELVESPLIFMERNNVRYSVEKLNVTNHTTKNKSRDKLFNLELEIYLGYDNYRQRS